MSFFDLLKRISTSDQGRMRMFSEEGPQIRQGLLQAAPVAADFTPIVGDVKGLLDAYNDPSMLNVGLGLAGLIPAVPNLKAAGKLDEFFSPEAMQRASSEARGNSRTAIADMTPREFLSMAKRMEGGSGKKIRGDSQMDDTPFLYVDMKKKGGELVGQVSGHEGRHRAQYLVDQGLGDVPMPVRVISREGGEVGAIRWNTDARRPTRLISEDDEILTRNVEGIPSYVKTLSFPQLRD